jgi:hypothetical protein
MGTTARLSVPPPIPPTRLSRSTVWLLPGAQSTSNQVLDTPSKGDITLFSVHLTPAFKL